MNITDTIYYLAESNAQKWAPRKSVEDIEKGVPYVHIQKNAVGKWTVTGHGHQGHDNEPRMDLYCDYFQNWVLPNVKANVSGYYNIELHDSYVYLNRDDVEYSNVMTFAKSQNDHGPILIPDPYMVCNWGDRCRSLHDKYTWEQKADKVCFYGTTTGSRDPAKNARIDWCLWAASRRPRYDFAITHVAQMNAHDIIRSIGLKEWQGIYRDKPVSMDEQMACKYLFLPDGNTCKFDVWPYFTKSLCLKDTSNDMLWYYPMLQDQHHFVEVKKDTIDQTVTYYIENPHEAQRITVNANHLADALFQPMSHILYTTALFETMAYNV